MEFHLFQPGEMAVIRSTGTKCRIKKVHSIGPNIRKHIRYVVEFTNLPLGMRNGMMLEKVVKGVDLKKWKKRRLIDELLHVSHDEERPNRNWLAVLWVWIKSLFVR